LKSVGFTPLAFGCCKAYGQAMRILFDPIDFSVIVKGCAPPPKPWRWEIYRAGGKSPVECSSVIYETVEAADRAGKAALKQLLTEFPD